MPKFDKTGPQGDGPVTGRGRGECSNNNIESNSESNYCGRFIKKCYKKGFRRGFSQLNGK